MIQIRALVTAQHYIHAFASTHEVYKTAAHSVHVAINHVVLFARSRRVFSVTRAVVALWASGPYFQIGTGIPDLWIGP